MLNLKEYILTFMKQQSSKGHYVHGINATTM